MPHIYIYMALYITPVRSLNIIVNSMDLVVNDTPDVGDGASDEVFLSRCQPSLNCTQKLTKHDHTTKHMHV